MIDKLVKLWARSVLSLSVKAKRHHRSDEEQLCLKNHIFRSAIKLEPCSVRTDDSLKEYLTAAAGQGLHSTCPHPDVDDMYIL